MRTPSLTHSLGDRDQELLIAALGAGLGLVHHLVWRLRDAGQENFGEGIHKGEGCELRGVDGAHFFGEPIDRRGEALFHLVDCGISLP